MAPRPSFATPLQDTRPTVEAFLAPQTFLGALAVFVIGSLIVRAIWPAGKK